MKQAWLESSVLEFDRWSAAGIDHRGARRIREGLVITAAGRIEQESDERGPTVFIPGLTGRPWWSPSDFPWVAGLEAAAAAIADELVANDSGADERGPAGLPPHLAPGGGWRALYLTCIGKPYERNVQRFPATLAALSGIPGATDSGMTYFSSVGGGTHIEAHTGFSNAHLRCHLSLITSDRSFLRVHDEVREWEQGRVMVFDDSYEHEVWNHGDTTRVVLLFDIWHPELTAAEISAMRHMMGVWRRAFSREYWSRNLLAAV